MGAVGDPLGIGIVTNLARPGGSVTGFSSRAAELEAKRLQLLKEVVPRTASGRHPLQPHEAVYAARAAERAKGARRCCSILAIHEVHDTTTLDTSLVTLKKIGRMPSWCRRTLFW